MFVLLWDAGEEVGVGIGKSFWGGCRIREWGKETRSRVGNWQKHNYRECPPKSMFSLGSNGRQRSLQQCFEGNPKINFHIPRKPVAMRTLEARKQTGS